MFKTNNIKRLSWFILVTVVSGSFDFVVYDPSCKWIKPDPAGYSRYTICLQYGLNEQDEHVQCCFFCEWLMLTFLLNSMFGLTAMVDLTWMQRGCSCQVAGASHSSI